MWLDAFHAFCCAVVLVTSAAVLAPHGGEGKGGDFCEESEFFPEFFFVAEDVGHVDRGAAPEASGDIEGGGDGAHIEEAAEGLMAHVGAFVFVHRRAIVGMNDGSLRFVDDFPAGFEGALGPIDVFAEGVLMKGKIEPGGAANGGADVVEDAEGKFVDRRELVVVRAIGDFGDAAFGASGDPGVDVSGDEHIVLGARKLAGECPHARGSSKAATRRAMRWSSAGTASCVMRMMMSPVLAAMPRLWVRPWSKS